MLPAICKRNKRNCKEDPMTKKKVIQQYRIIVACTFVCGLGIGAFLAVVALAGGLLP